jgi:hypothetical protein
MTNRAGRLAGIAVLAATAAWGCGKKGAPLPPFVRIPAGVEMITASRLGNDVYVTLTVPTTNIDKSLPIDISRIEVFGYTGRVAPTAARWAELGTVVASIPVVPPSVGADDRPLPQVPTGEGAIAGAPVTIVDPLTAEDFVQGPLPPVDPRVAALPPLADPVVPAVLKRFYLAVGFSQRGRPGPPGAQAELVLTSLPDPPADLRVAYGPTSITLTWEPSGGLLGFLMDRPLPPEPLPYDTILPVAAAGTAVTDASVPPGPTTYNVYRQLAPDPFALPLPASPPWNAPPLAAVNPAPLTMPSLTDTVDDGRARCYIVRAQRGTVMSDASMPLCVTPVDVFPPAAPAGLAAVPSEGGISLIWEPNAELDLDGYLVLRREAGDATLRQLTERPVAESRYRDTDVKAGTRYIYSIAAVDRRLPLPNVSALSAPVEETAR